MTAQEPSPGPSSGEGVFSLEDLDKIIEAEDPSFKKEMDGLKATKTDASVNIESIESNEEEDSTAHEENADDTFKQKLLKKLKRPWFWLKEKTKLRIIWLKNKSVLTYEHLKTFFWHEFPDRVRYIKSRLIAGLAWTKTVFAREVNRIKALSRAEKISVVFMTITAVGCLFFLGKTFSGALLPHFNDPLIHSLSEQSGFYRAYKTKEELQDLFEAFPEVEYQVLLTKVIVNLKPDENSGKNPMGLYELYLGVDSQDTAIEVKDREHEILDIVQRSIEGFTYSEVSSTVGKMRMKSVVRDRVNMVLNQGKIFHVYFNSFVTSP